MDTYESWQKFCKESDEKVKKYNDGPRDKCPFCHNDLEASWNYDSDYTPYFFIECTNCSMRLKDSYMEGVLNQLHGKR